MAVTQEDIRRLRRELERDLEAVNRVEALLARKNGVGPTTATTQARGARGELKRLTIEVLKAAGVEGMRPVNLLKAVTERGYAFRSEKGAAGSVSTVLKRLVEKKKVEKKDKMYIWKSSGAAKTLAE